jgi:pyridoxal phosphate enzyme (YggS family)
MNITESVHNILEQLPCGVDLVAAVKTRSAEEVLEAVRAGVRHIGHNYVQEAESMYPLVGSAVEWHCIGHLQRNKVKKAVALFDMIETVDSYELAAEIDKRCAAIDKVMDVLVEINSGREENKSGVFPENARQLIREMSVFSRIRIRGLMTMGPPVEAPEVIRPYFRLTKELYDELSVSRIENVTMNCLSMGMSGSWRVAVEEGATMVRIGTALFGVRSK